MPDDHEGGGQSGERPGGHQGVVEEGGLGDTYSPGDVVPREDVEEEAREVGDV